MASASHTQPSPAFGLTLHRRVSRQIGLAYLDFYCTTLTVKLTLSPRLQLITSPILSLRTRAQLGKVVRLDRSQAHFSLIHGSELSPVEVVSLVFTVALCFTYS
jgi:hypothetical protein